MHILILLLQPTLGMGTYNLKIWGDLGPDAVRSPGQLQPNTALQFALYTPQAYTPIASGECQCFIFGICFTTIVFVFGLSGMN
jgi:hypothetical protein